jgi:hypothetical protein
MQKFEKFCVSEGGMHEEGERESGEERARRRRERGKGKGVG